MRRILAGALLIYSAATAAQPGYSPLAFSGGEVAIRDAVDTLRDWRMAGDASHELLVHDRAGQWYRVRVAREQDCTFGRTAPLVGAYGTDFRHMFGPGMWIQNTAYPYKRCLVHSTRPVATPTDQVGVDYADEYRLTVHQIVARKVRCRQRMDSIWTRPLASEKKIAALCN